MDFNLNEDQRMIKDTIRRFAENELGPIAEDIDKEDRFPKEQWQSLAELGVMGITVPEAYGGPGMDVLSAVLVMEELSRVCPAVSLSWLAHSILCTANICNHGNETQREKYLPDLCSGKHIGCLALTEPGAGSDAVGIRTHAVKKGNEYVINGSKTFITNAPVADVALLYAKTDPDRGSRGITAFIVDAHAEGFNISKKIEKMGHRGSPTGEISLEDLCVPEENVLIGHNRGIEVMMHGLDIERIVIAGGPVGVAQAALEMSVRYAGEREQFGRAIGNFQFIQGMLADIYAELESARLLVYRAAVAAEESRRGGKGTEIHKLAAAAALLASEMGEKAATRAVQIHGGYGYTLEYAVNRLMRDTRLYTIGAGTSEIRRIIVARELMTI